MNIASTTKKLMALLLSFVMLAGITACSGGTEPQGDKKATAGPVLKIGSVGPLTGSASIYGSSAKKGAEIAVEEINAAEQDFQIEFMMHDDEADGEKGVNAYNKLKDWGMQLLMGAVTTGSCVAVSAEAYEDRVFTLTPSASSGDVTAGKDNVFQVCFTDPNQGIKAANYISDHFADKHVGVIYNNSDPYSTGIYNAFKKEYEAKGKELVAVETYPDDTNADFSAQLTSLKAAGADLVLLPIYYTPASVILRQAKDMNYAPDFFGLDGMDGILDIEGFDKSLSEGLMLMTPFNPWSDDAKVQAFVAKFQEKYQELPNQFAADGYDGIYALYKAFKASGLSTDLGHAEICEQMLSTFTGDFSYDGLTGDKMTWSTSGEVSKEPTICVIKDGQYADVK